MSISAKDIEAARLQGDLPQATNLLREAVLLDGGKLTEATGHQYALLLQASKNYQGALDVLHLLRARLPKNAQVALQVGQCHELLGDYVPAKEAFKLATELHAKHDGQPDVCRAWFGLGSQYFRLGKPDEGLECWERGLEERCDSHDARFQRSHVLLALGRFAEGWQDYESRKQLMGYKASVRSRGLDPDNLPPEWNGRSQGRVLVYGTMGAGDCIQFSRYIPFVEDRSGVIPKHVLGAPLEAWYGLAAGGGCDYSVALDSLPLVLDMRAPIGPRVTADALCARIVRNVIKPLRPKIGVCWEGSSGHMGNHDRSSPLDFRVTFQDPRWEIVSLQVGKGFDPKDYRETADVMQTLDAIVTVDTSVVHMAGTLGVPTACIPPSSPEWRWGTSGSETPWYPSVKLVRRSRWDAWPDAIARAKKLIGEML